jgi:DNA-binding CsgD family transcriptional regulator/pimeloyl-ACP methyl ester carboxylesterase
MDVPALRYVTTPDGFSIAYTVYGEGPPLVYLPHDHSHINLFWRSRNVMRLLYEHLAARFTLVCYDRRGWGSSQRGLPDTFNVDDFQTDLEAVVDHLGLERFSMLAQRNASRTALRFAAQQPARVRAIVLWNARSGERSIDGWVGSQILTLASGNWDYFVDVMARTGWAPENLDVAKRFVRECTTQTDMLTVGRANQEFTLKDVVGRVKTPVMLLASATGSNPTAAEAGSKWIASQIPGAPLEVLDDFGGGLFTLDAEPPRGVLLIDDFFSKLPPELAATPPAVAAVGTLSTREEEVLRLIARGLSNQQIADELVLSVRTVERHINHIYEKLGVHSKAQATAYALRNSPA